MRPPLLRGRSLKDNRPRNARETTDNVGQAYSLATDEFGQIQMSFKSPSPLIGQVTAAFEGFLLSEIRSTDRLNENPAVLAHVESGGVFTVFVLPIYYILIHMNMPYFWHLLSIG